MRAGLRAVTGSVPCAAAALNAHLLGVLRKTHPAGPLALGLKGEWELTPAQKRGWDISGAGET